MQDLVRELQAKDALLKAVQRNYKALSNILHERLKLLDDASKHLVAERSENDQLRSSLTAATIRAATAEQHTLTQQPLTQQLVQLQREAETLRAARNDDCQQRQALTDQLSRLKQELATVTDSKQQLLLQLEEQRCLARAEHAATAKLKQQLEEEKTACRTLQDMLQGLRDAASHSQAAEQAAQQQLAVLQARVEAAEEAAAAEASQKKAAQAELASAKGGQAHSALKLLNLSTNHTALQDQLTRIGQALANEQAARADAAKQLLELQSQLLTSTRRAEAAEAGERAAAIQLSIEQATAAAAATAQVAAEEACKAAEARTKLVAGRLAEAQQQAAQDRGVAEATHRELRDCLADKDAALLHLKQQQQCWAFRQLEVWSRAINQLEKLSGRVARLEAAAGVVAAALDQQREQQQGTLEQLLQRLGAWQAAADELLLTTSGRMSTSLIRLQQQAAAQQQRLRSSSKQEQLMKQHLEQLEQQLTITAVTERKLRAELESEQATRSNELVRAQQEVYKATGALATAEQAAAAAQSAASESATTIAQLQTKLAMAESGRLSLQLLLAANDAELSGSTSNLRAAGRSFQQLAMAATQLSNVLQQCGVMSPQAVAQLSSALSGCCLSVASRPSTPSSRPRTASSRPGTATTSSAVTGQQAGPRPRTPPQPDALDQTGGAASNISAEAAGAVAVAPRPDCRGDVATAAAVSTTSVRVPDASSKQLLEGLSCLQQQMAAITAAVQRLAEQQQWLQQSQQEGERELNSTAAKLVHVEESLSSNYTCLICMHTFDRPVSVVPCGHMYCKACLLSAGGCLECSGGSIMAGAAGPPPAYVPALALERLCAKHEYRMQALQGLQRLLLSRRLE